MATRSGVLDDMSRGRKDRLRGVDCEIVNDGVRVPVAVVNAMRGCDSVIHLACCQDMANFSRMRGTIHDLLGSVDAVTEINTIPAAHRLEY